MVLPRFVEVSSYFYPAQNIKRFAPKDYHDPRLIMAYTHTQAI
jgi:hypothetical protein